MKHILHWNIYQQLAAQAVAEGIVMLKNEGGALPLQPQEEIALFGRIQLHYYKSGTGSGGMVNVSKVVSVPEGLTDFGIRLYAPVADAYRKWDEANPYDLGGGWGGEPWSQAEMPLDDALAADAAAHCERAIVIIGRTAGEEQDNRMEQGSYLLTDTELEMMRTVRRHFRKMIVLLNTGNIIDMHFLDEIQPDALLYIWQGGMTGGTGTAAVLTGKISPSGKLPDTIAYDITDYPSDPDFGGKDRNIYREDIFVGYRYFETFAPEKVRFPFGFGMSYTKFVIEHAQISETSVRVIIRNIGKCPGKEAVQIYCEAPQGKLGKPARVLTAIAKTGTLEPGTSETLVLPLTLPASYDDSGVTGCPHAWVLEPGDYRFFLGTDVRSASPVQTVHLDSLTVIKQCRQAMAPVIPFRRMTAAEENGSIVLHETDTPLMEYDEAARRLQALPDEFAAPAKSCLLTDVFAGTASLDDFIAQLTDDELMQIVRGEGMGSPRVTPGTASAFGGVSDALTARGIPAACCSDGPSGMRLDCGTKAFSLPNGTMLAATFNPTLLQELYYCVGMEMTANKVDCLLGPGMNIHRHPLNGRNFEYFSEDPYLTGVMACAELSGLHRAGVEGTIKHCCGNNQETGRHFLDSVVSERALREIYLKGFEMAVCQGGAQSIMTTYGSVNGLWTAGNYDLCTEIIRGEWGYTGFLMTDWWANINERGQAPDRNLFAAMARAQNDVYMVCADCVSHEDNLAAALADGTLTRAELQRNAANICRFLLHTHAMQRLMENHSTAFTADSVEVIGRPAEDTDSDVPVVFYDLDHELTVDLTKIPTDKGTAFAFALKVKTPGWYQVTLTASSEQSPLAQIPVTLFSMGTASGTFTWNGTDGKPVSFSKQLPIFSHFTTMRLYFAQSGIRMHSIAFTLANDDFDVSKINES